MEEVSNKENNYSIMSLDELKKEYKLLSHQIDDLCIERNDIIIDKIAKRVVRDFYIEDHKKTIITSIVAILVNFPFAVGFMFGQSLISLINLAIVAIGAAYLNVSYARYKKQYMDTAKKTVIKNWSMLANIIEEMDIYNRYEIEISKLQVKLNQVENYISLLENKLSENKAFDNPYR